MHVPGPLFTPVRIGPLQLDGRLIKTATAETRATHEGFVTAQVLEFYIPMARGGTPLIITGNIYVSADGKSAPRQLAPMTTTRFRGSRISQTQCTRTVRASWRSSITAAGR